MICVSTKNMLGYSLPFPSPPPPRMAFYLSHFALLGPNSPHSCTRSFAGPGFTGSIPTCTSLTFCIPILLLTACFPSPLVRLPEPTYCVTLVLSTYARLTLFSRPAQPSHPSTLPHARHSPSIPAVNSPYLPHPPLDQPSWPVTPFAFPHAGPPRPALLPRRLTALPSLLDLPSSPLAHPRGFTLVGPTLSALVLKSRRRLTLSDTRPYRLSSRYSQPPFPLSLRLTHSTPVATCLALLPMQISRRGWRMSIVFASFRRPGWTKSKRDQCQQMVRGSARRCCSALMPS